MRDETPKIYSHFIHFIKRIINKSTTLKEPFRGQRAKHRRVFKMNRHQDEHQGEHHVVVVIREHIVKYLGYHIIF